MKRGHKENIVKHIFLQICGFVLGTAILFAPFSVLATVYTPGETLNPDCAPTDMNCSVIAPAASGANSDITSLSGLAFITSTNAYFTNLVFGNGTAATLTISATTTLNGGFFQNTLGNCSSEAQTLLYNATTGRFLCGVDGTTGTSTTNFTTPVTVNDGIHTSALYQDGLFIATSTADLSGLFYVDVNGNVSASGTIKVFGNTLLSDLAFATANGTSITTTNAFFANVGLSNILATNVTTTNFNVTGQVTLPTNSITDAFVVNGLTIDGGTINNTTIGATGASTGIFTNITSTNAFVQALAFGTANGTSITTTNLSFISLNGTNVTSTNLSISGTTNLGQTTITNGTSTNFNASGLSFTTANGGSVTSTNGSFSRLATTGVTTTNLSFGIADGTSITSTNGFFTTLGVTNFAPSNMVATNVTTTNLSISGLTVLANTTISNVTSTNLSFGTSNGTSITTTNAFFSNLAFGVANGTSITSTNANFSGITFTNLFGSNVTTTNFSFTSASGTNSIVTNATSTNIFVNSLVFGSAQGTSLTIGATTTMQTSTIAGGFFQTGLTNCSLESQSLLYDSATGKFVCGIDGGGTASSTAGGADTQIQFNDGGAFNGSSALTFNTSTNLFSALNANLTGFTFGTASGTSITSTNGFFSTLVASNFAPSNINAGSITSTNLNTTGLTFGTANGTSITTTNAFAGLFGVTNLSATNITTTNFNATGQITLPTNSISDAFVVNGLTIDGGTINNTTIGATGASTGIFIDVTSTNISGTMLVISATSSMQTSTIAGGFFQTGLGDCSLESQSLLYNSATGKFVCGVDATGGVGSFDGLLASPLFVTDGTTTSTLRANGLYIATSSANISGLFAVDNIGSVSASGTLSIFGTSNFATATASLVVIGGGTILPNSPLQIGGNTSSYLQVNVQNSSNGSRASSDYVATANDGTDSTFYLNTGINGSGYSDPTFDITGSHDGYLYVHGGNLAIGTASSTNIIKFFTGGTVSTTERVRITDNGISINTTTAGFALNVSGISNFVGSLSFTSVSGTSVTSTNFFSSNISYSGLSGINSTSTNLFATSSIFINSTSTNVNISRSLRSATSTFFGAVSINTTSAGTFLTVMGSGAGVGLVRYQNTTSTGYTSFDLYDDANVLQFSFGHANTSTGGLANLNYINSNALNPIIFAMNNAEAIRIVSTLKVGIGTSSPQTLLSLAASTTRFGGLSFATDAFLYRSLANTIKTDGNFNIVGGVSSTFLFATSSVFVNVTTTNLSWTNASGTSITSTRMNSNSIIIGSGATTTAMLKMGTQVGFSGLLDVAYPATGGYRALASANFSDGAAFQVFGGLEPSFAGQAYFDYGSTLRNVSGRQLLFRNMSSGTVYTNVLVADENNNITIQSGNLGIGITTAPTAAKLVFATSTIASGGIAFSNDTLLYRSATNTLRTNGNFTINGGVTSTFFFATSSVFINVTSTNLAITGLTNLAETTITNITSTNHFSTDLTFSNLIGTNATSTNLSVSGLTMLANGLNVSTTEVYFSDLTAPGATSDVVCFDVGGKLTHQAASCSVSSERFKHDINSWNGGLSTIMQLNPVSYKRNSDNVEELGLIAEQVDLVDKHFVVYEVNSTTPRSVDYARLVIPLISAIKEQQEQINGLMFAYVGISSTTPGTTSEEELLFSANRPLVSAMNYLLDKIAHTAFIIKDFVAERVTAMVGVFHKVKTESIEMNDSVTGETYCMRIINGELVHTKGNCTNTLDTSDTPANGSNNQTPSDNSENSVETTPSSTPEDSASSSTSTNEEGVNPSPDQGQALDSPENSTSGGDVEGSVSTSDGTTP